MFLKLFPNKAVSKNNILFYDKIFNKILLLLPFQTWMIDN